MKTDVASQIARFEGLGRDQLKKIWAENFTQPPPEKLRKELMISLLAYRIQERESGGLSHVARTRLAQIARSLRSEKRLKGSSVEAPEKGMKLVRSWGGEIHEVLSTDNGFEYRGRQFNSLSQIARVITGTRWSGPLFFGTRKP